MSVPQIHNFIVHQIIRDSVKNAFLKPRGGENTIDELTSEVVDNLLDLFNNTGLQTGSFGQESGKPKFEQTLSKNSQCIDGKFEFHDFTQMTIDLARILEGEMNKGGGKAAKPNYIVFFHHTTNEKSFFTVITLLETKGFTLENLSFQKIERLDLDRLHLAARIRLHDWNDEISKDKYISFRIGKNSEMRDYFQEFIGCEEFTAAKVETKSLVEAIKKCCFDIYGDESDKVHEILDLAGSYCKDSKDEEGKISIISLGKHLFPDNDGYLLRIAQDEPYGLSERVSINNRGLQALRRFHGRNKKMSISFDSDLIQSRKVFYDEKKGSLTFYELPKDLKTSLDKGQY